MWQEGKTLSQIAKKIPLTRNAILRVINAYESTGGLNPGQETMTFTKTDDPQVKEAYERILALRRLTTETGRADHRRQT
jgi:transposase